MGISDTSLAFRISQKILFQAINHALMLRGYQYTANPQTFVSLTLIIGNAIPDFLLVAYSRHNY